MLQTSPQVTKAADKTAVLYRMVMKKHICPWGLKTKYLLEQEGFSVEDHWLKTRAETDAFKEQHHVDTTPQTFRVNPTRFKPVFAESEPPPKDKKGPWGTVGAQKS
jgi:glutaredoxin